MSNPQKLTDLTQPVEAAFAAIPHAVGPQALVTDAVEPNLMNPASLGTMPGTMIDTTGPTAARAPGSRRSPAFEKDEMI